MHHQHFSTIPSTQIYLRDHLNEFNDKEVLISCSEQTQGIGRTGNAWDFYPNSLAMSFLITPHSTPTLTSIEMGLLTLDFMKNKFNINLFLKWPNDLMTVNSEKCGGIICNYLSDQKIIAGLGINLNTPTNNYPYKTTYIVLNKTFTQKDLSLEIYKYILKNRIETADKIVEKFNANCIHHNKMATLNDESSSYYGIFKGINEIGEATIEIDGIMKKFFSGTLTLN